MFSIAISSIIVPLLYTAVHHWLMVLIPLVIYSFTSTLMKPPVNAPIASTAPREKRATLFGILDAILTIPAILGPLIGGYVIELYGYRSLFMITAFLGIISFISIRL